MRWPRSKVGLLFVGLYLLAAAVMFSRIANCVGMFCDFEAFPVVVPFGVICIYAVKALDLVYFFGTSYTSYRWSTPAFVISTVLGNMVFYYWVGVFAAWVVKKLLPQRREKI